MTETNISFILHQSVPEKREALLSGHVRRLLAGFLEIDSPEEISETEVFAELGTGSLQAIEFKSLLESDLGCKLRTSLLFDYPRLDLLVHYLLHEVLLPGVQTTAAVMPSLEEQSVQSVSAGIAVIGMEGVFPGAANADALWDKVVSGTFNSFSLPEEQTGYHYGRLEPPFYSSHLDLIGITAGAFAVMDLHQQLLYKLLADAMVRYGLTLQDLTARKTGVFIAAQQLYNDEEQAACGFRFDPDAAYQVPLPNKISFRLNLQGPSEVVNTFCTSVYVALHRGIQSILAGECDQAVIGGINLISAKEFNYAAQAGLYDGLLSADNHTRSFSGDANGFVRSEGAGVIIIKSAARAEEDNNHILAFIRGSFVHHGGKGYSLEAPNVKGIRDTISACYSKAQVDAGTIDYIEAHGIANHLADALELEAISDSYHLLSSDVSRKWHISSVKPTVGHPEIAAGMASVIKALQAIAHRIIPGIAGLDTVNTEIGERHFLILRKDPSPWPNGIHPRRMALNSYAIGGVNAHVILEEYKREWQDALPSVTEKNTAQTPAAQPVALTAQQEDLVSNIMQEVFHMELSQVDRSLSPVHYGFDSIKMVQLVRRINEAMGIHVRIGQVLGVDSFNAFLQLLAREEGEQQPVIVSPVTASSGSPARYPASEVQKGLWYINQTSPESTSFNVPMLFSMKVPLQEACLLQAFERVLLQYPALRANFIQEEETEEIVQETMPVENYLRIHHQRVLKEQTTTDVCFSLLRQPFNLGTDPLIRLYVISTDDTADVHVLFIVHHIVIDGISAITFTRSFWNAYRQAITGQPVHTTAQDLAFRDFIEWEKHYLNGRQADDDFIWWKAYLADISPTINLPYDRLPLPGLPSSGMGCEHLSLQGHRLQAFKGIAATLNVNLSVLLLAIFKVFLYKITLDEDIAVTTPVEGRPKPSHENSVGCYINLVVTRSYINAEKHFDTLVKEIRKQFNDGMDHGFYPFSKLLPVLGLTSPRETPLPVSFTYQNIFDGLIDHATLLQEIEMVYDVYQETEDNYTFEVYDLRTELQLKLKYKRTLFDDTTIKRHADYFNRLLDAIMANHARQIKEYHILPDDEKEMLLKAFNNTTAIYPEDKCIHELVAHQASVTPDNVALIFDGVALTYREMDTQSRQLAHYLQQQGVTADTLVAVCIERSPQMIIALLGILYAGGAYLPLDASNTTADGRIMHILKEGDVQLLLTSPSIAGKLERIADETGTRLITVNEILQEAKPAMPLFQTAVRPHHLAYVIYTSGSTGKPKGVMISHGALVNLSLHMIRQYEITAGDRILQFASLSFDMSVEEIFPYLICGAAVVIRRDEDLQADYFHRTVTENKVSIVNIPPLYFNVIRELSADQQQTLFTCVRLIAFGGEAIQEAVLKSAQLTGVRIYNAYGPTEYTVNAAIAELTGAREITIGVPVSNTQFYVLGKDMNLLPAGLPGELYIAGYGLADGYLGQPELTAEKFISNPFGKGKLYRTGDVVRWRPDGQVAYIGRSDNQIKMRGFRIEPGEIENLLTSHEHVAQAAVIVRSYPQGNKLIAYYVSAAAVKENLLRAFLQQQLPDYMIPAAFIPVDELPLTANGKVNRKLLQSWKADIIRQADYMAPRTELEAALVRIWEEILNIRPIGIYDNFFELGGHSLSSIQMIGKTMARFRHIEIQVNDIIRYPSIEALCRYILSRPKDENDLEPNPYIVKLRPGGNDGELSFIIPGMPGLADGYYDLATHLPGEEPVYGLQMKGFMGEEPLDSVEEMAIHNIALINSTAPGNKAINIYTHSYGGAVVYEMLRQIRGSMIKINRVVLIDCSTTIALNSITKDSVHLFCDAIVAYFGIKPQPFYKQLNDVFFKPKRQWKELIVKLIYESEMRANKNIFMNLMKFMDRSISVDYAMSEKLPYAVTIIEANKKSYLMPNARPWDDYFEHTRIIHSDGDHLTIIHAPYSFDWIRQL
ncbi:MAG TPA: amino acid adenylation domain-containing protein [Chitinophaga sp.]|uniref:non-ribosomal peptide synthetase n=1 Tax=Chitinophaga sp. TaxID=1869181 RepID=UPI002C2E1EA3|nr:non-ribosomal peptide synthetase [Chitinophaga sp.]HVI45038.1 amino acid adenylation domain-containing protein [Chitinophaga sp.]